MVLTLQFISDDSDSVKEVSKILGKYKGKKVCYVTLNKSCGAMREIFGKAKLNPDKVYYIDGISSNLGSPKAVKGCSYVSTPYELKPLTREIKKAIKKGSSVVIFDSLSNILAYGSSIPAGMNILVDFIGSFYGGIEKKKGDAIFLCKKKDAKNLLIEETVPAFGKVIGGAK